MPWAARGQIRFVPIDGTEHNHYPIFRDPEGGNWGWPRAYKLQALHENNIHEQQWFDVHVARSSTDETMNMQVRLLARRHTICDVHCERCPTAQSYETAAMAYEEGWRVMDIGGNIHVTCCYQCVAKQNQAIHDRFKQEKPDANPEKD